MPSTDMNKTPLTVILPEDSPAGNSVPSRARFGRALEAVVSAAGKENVTFIRGTENIPASLCDRRILFAVSLPADGICEDLFRLLRLLRTSDSLLEGATGALLVDGGGALYTKSTAAQLVFAANRAGCAFIGRPLVEATGDLSNFHVIADNLGTDLENAYLESVHDLVTRLLAPAPFPHKGCACPAASHTSRSPLQRNVRTGNTAGLRPKLLALHASSHETSNTLALWHAVRDRLDGIDTHEISLRNGTLSDCSGCSFELCLHYGEQDSCFYGGVMVEEVYPALREADAILMVCPNYNDAIGANLTAFINRLTAMYRAHPFTGKALFAIVVSGYSGSDMLATQLIAALNMNKSFYLPPRFCLTATAHAPGSAMQIPGIHAQLDAFADSIRQTMTG